MEVDADKKSCFAQLDGVKHRRTAEKTPPVETHPSSSAVALITQEELTGLVKNQ